MNYIKHLTGFFKKTASLKNINPSHISLYLALFQCWNINRFKNPITINREEIMISSKIKSKATYHKCMKELQALGFIKYTPSFNPYLGSEVEIYNLSETANTSSKNECTFSKIEQVNSQVTEQVNSQLYIENKKTSKNNINTIERTPEFENLDENLILGNKEKKGKEKSSAKKEKDKAVNSNEMEKPTLALAKEYFKFQQYSEFEAERFFNYYSSNGWLIGGKTKMKDWKAAARNWMLNTSKFNIKTPQNIPITEQTRAYNLHTVTDKNYGEPL
ncbi:hypothetical protein SAMN05444395_10939 [Flavobacterium fryxellicola]|uniref:Uncharacterized protein n=1 Tax=Flavobacterium fryxellicola TaxID=249352 RepID=A0A167U7D4_9FLAO|nr:hypothetical protein [Flavobacterium fryxellicola]OAB25327.1 hypothetical protein FBFR_15200 [Flavobacterium fryxellicola]SHN75103.1 hypothetical protein SAMN05444395_10939 [Flavobacterium fryxellicola]